MKQALLTILLFILPMMACADNGGSCGDNLTWKYEPSTKTLTISGSGAMKDYTGLDRCPWYSYYYSNSVVKAVIEEGVTSIGNYAFCECGDLQDIIIPNSMISIGHRAFYKCYNLTSVTIPNNVTTIYNGAFEESGLKSISIPNSINAIQDNTFKLCRSLSSAAIPSSVTKIGDNAFYRCPLNSVLIPNGVTTIGNNAFQYCKMTTLTIPNSVKTIGNSAFQACTNMTSVIIGENVTSIGESAFLYCENLSRVLCYPEEAPTSKNTAINYSANIFVSETAYPSYKSSSEWANRNVRTTEIEPIEVGGIYYNIGVISSFAEITQKANGHYDVASLEIPRTISYDNREYDVKYVGYEAFCGCENLVKVTIPNSVTSIGYRAFDGCRSLFSIDIPNSVVTIGERAFYGCSSLNSLVIGNNVINISDLAFYGCSSLLSLSIPHNVTSIGIRAFSNCESLSSVSIGNGMTSIGDGAFEVCRNLMSLNLGNNVSNIGENAFYYCEKLTTISIPSSVSRIGDKAFLFCSSLKSVQIEDLSTWCQIQFDGVWANPLKVAHHLYLNGKEVKDLVIPNTITLISDYAFYGCWGLTSVDIPNNVTSIGAEAFSNCISTISANISNSVTTIGESAFSECTSLQSVKIPDGLQLLKNRLFYGCLSLRDITIPSSIEVIYQEAFAKCNELESINLLPTTPPFIYDNSFSNYSVHLKVPKGCKEAYQTALGWMNFTNISDADKYKIIYIVDGEQYKTEEIEEGEAITPEAEPTKEGYTFSGWSDLPETMPAKDVTVTGTFTVNKYKLTYSVDGEEYKSYDVEYGSTITSETEPTKEGYTFSGWSDLPETMPAKDVTVTGTFTVNKYKLTYSVDGEEYKSYDIEYGSTITSETEPTKEGYTFSGWNDIPETMPAKDVTVTGTFTVNKYKLTYSVDGEEYKSYDVEYGSTITSETEPTQEGYTFSGWSNLPETMPAKDVTVTGTFTINKYKVTYMIDGEVYQTVEVEYGSTITPPNPGNREGYDFAWGDYPSTMPAEDITINGSYTATDIRAILADESDVKIFTVSGKPLNNMQKGVNILRYKDGRTQKLIIK